MDDADFARFTDRHTFEYVRTFPHPIERVWRAVSDPAEISEWFWTARFELRLGGAFQFGPDDIGIKGVIAALEPPRLIRFSDPPAGREGYFELRLTPVEGGTEVVLVQHGTPDLARPDWPPPGLLAGWHRNIDHLGAFLDGATWASDGGAAEAALAERYRQRMPNRFAGAAR